MGSNTQQVAKDLNTTLELYGTDIFFTKSMNNVFCELWGIPKDEIAGLIGYRKSVVPNESFRLFKTSNGDICIFYQDKFYAYYFSVVASNYDVYYNEITSKYGSSTESKSFPGYDVDGAKIFDIATVKWISGRTLIFLIKYVMDPGLGMTYTNVSVLYSSESIFYEIVNTIRDNMSKEEDLKQKQKEKYTNDDLSKIR